MKKLGLGLIVLLIAGCTGVRGYDGHGRVCLNSTWMGFSLIEVFSPCSDGHFFSTGADAESRQSLSYQNNDEQISRQMDSQFRYMPRAQVYQRSVPDLEAERRQQKQLDYENRHYNRYQNDYLRYHR